MNEAAVDGSEDGVKKVWQEIRELFVKVGTAARAALTQPA
jgi:hypothetical protein